MDKFFLRLGTFIYRITWSPFLKNIVTLAVVTPTVVEITSSFMIAFSPNFSWRLRSMGAMRGSAALGAFITSLLAPRIIDPVLAATFRLTCALCSSFYVFSGGNSRLALSYIYISRKIS